jgi:hypothetical protein
LTPIGVAHPTAPRINASAQQNKTKLDLIDARFASVEIGIL